MWVCMSMRKREEGEEEGRERLCGWWLWLWVEGEDAEEEEQQVLRSRVAAGAMLLVSFGAWIRSCEVV